MLTILSGRDARRGKGFLENAENAQGNEGGHRRKRNIQLKKIFQC